MQQIHSGISSHPKRIRVANHLQKSHNSSLLKYLKQSSVYLETAFNRMSNLFSIQLWRENDNIFPQTTIILFENGDIIFYFALKFNTLCYCAHLGFKFNEGINLFSHIKLMIQMSTYFSQLLHYYGRLILLWNCQYWPLRLLYLLWPIRRFGFFCLVET